eukprot:1460049-Prymnesium_polylepis.2
MCAGTVRRRFERRAHAAHRAISMHSRSDVSAALSRESSNKRVTDVRCAPPVWRTIGAARATCAAQATCARRATHAAHAHRRPASHQSGHQRRMGARSVGMRPPS